jgi:hypothetical protein
MMITKIKTAYGLGLGNLVRVLYYRLGIKLGINPVKKIQSTIKQGVFFEAPERLTNAGLKANEQWQSQQCYFGWKLEDTVDIPNWHKSVLTNVEVEQPNLDWWKIPDFSTDLGDIKGVWEASRFEWVLGFAQLAAQGESSALHKLNLWLSDWCLNNPPYKGVNWKCGQETSIRVMHVAMATIILHQYDKSSLVLTSFIKAHLKRIAPTINYAVAQDNNHGTSEATALFIGGSLLTLNGDADGTQFYKLGLKWLENRANCLIEADGSFSQYSTTYHRVMLDTYSMAEIWRRKLSLPEFSLQLTYKLKAATSWLYQFTQSTTGDVPNLGANDGARLLPLTANGYRDFRPSVQLAAILFHNKKAWVNDGDWNLPLQWFKIQLPKDYLSEQTNFYYPVGGYFGLRSNESKAFMMMTYPKFRFRPSQCDALHIDFWFEGKNLLRDGGTFSYNAGEKYIQYYGGTESHNTVQFDQREQMPRLSRFLLGNWLKAYNITFNAEKNKCGATYNDAFGATHKRNASLIDHTLKVEDTLTNVIHSAVLRWRLSPDNWNINGNSISNGKHTLTIKSDVEIKRFELTLGRESRYYYQETEIPVLEVEVSQACKIITEYKF